MRIALIAGEPSGDGLGAGLIAALRTRLPQAQFEGIGGERMQAEGLDSLFPLDELAVMGLVEVLAHLPRLLHIRRSLRRHFTARPPDVFIGIDAPDFNLPLEQTLRARGVRTVHYVSPQVWAWRPGRVRAIARAVNLMLTLLPFEAAFYQTHRVPVRYVGHPLADEIPLHSDRAAARQQLGLEPDRPWLALLPGSRLGEVRRLAPLFLAVADWLRERQPDWCFIIPAASAPIHAYLGECLAGRSGPVVLVRGQARAVLAAADGVLVASGTATLETLLVKRPMVVAYRVAPLSAWLARHLIRVPWFALPNLLAGRLLVPEFIQETATVDHIGPALWRLMTDEAACQLQLKAFVELHGELRHAASERAAAAIAELLD